MFKNIFLVILMFAFSSSVWAEEISVTKLPNGQTVIVKEVRDNPIVTVDTWIKTGSINENDSNSGVAHFLEHLFFKGTKKHPTGEFDSILESKGAIVNAATSKDYTHYYITIPSMYFDKTLELHADMLMNPQIPRKELEKERKVVLEEIAKDKNNPNKLVYNNLNSLLYSHHPYKRTVLGSADVISTIRREEILDFFNKHYVPSNMVTIIVGDVTTKDAVEKVSKYFNTEAKKINKTSYKKERPILNQKRKVEYFDSTTGYMMMGFRVPDINSSETYALDVLAQVLGQGKTSRLYRNIKEQKGLASNIFARNYGFKDDGIFFISANFSGANVDKLEKNIFDEISNIQKYGITEEELSAAKKMIEQEVYFSKESTSNIATYLGSTIVLTDSIDDYENYVPKINKVKIDEVQKVAQKYLGINKSAISIVLPKTLENKQVKEIKEHTAKKISESNSISKYLIDNNSTLILNKHDNNDIIAISIFAKGGNFIEKISGETDLLASTMLRGTKKYSAQELAKLMEENGISIKLTADSDYFLANIKTTTSQIDLTLELLDEIFNNALFEDFELEKARTELLNNYKQRHDLPMNIALDNFTSNVFLNSVYSKTANSLKKTIPTISKENILNLYNRNFDAKNIIISVNGNVETQKMINAFGNIFTEKNTPKFDYSKYSVQKLNNPKFITQEGNDLKTTWLFLGWQTNAINDLKDFVVLKLINTLLGNGMSSRLYKNLREQHGLAYQLGSSYIPKALSGSFITYIGTNPETLKMSEQQIKKEIEALKLGFVSDSELQNAKERLKGGFIIGLETNSNKAINIGHFEVMGLGYDFLDKYIKMIDEVTASDIVRVANKYFNNSYVESIIK